MKKTAITYLLVLSLLILPLSGCQTTMAQRERIEFEVDRAINIAYLGLSLAEANGWEEATKIKEIVNKIERLREGDPEAILEIIEIVLTKLDDERYLEIFLKYRDLLKTIIDNRLNR